MERNHDDKKQKNLKKTQTKWDFLEFLSQKKDPRKENVLTKNTTTQFSLSITTDHNKFSKGKAGYWDEFTTDQKKTTVATKNLKLGVKIKDWKIDNPTIPQSVISLLEKRVCGKNKKGLRKLKNYEDFVLVIFWSNYKCTKCEVLHPLFSHNRSSTLFSEVGSFQKFTTFR